MYLVDHLHQRGIGVLLDWVPSHFPTDEHGLGFFDGTHLFEHEDPRQGFHPEWSSSIFNYGRNEVRSFLISSGLFWLDKYHLDGLRVDAVASMLYLDYARKDGEWIPNAAGGRENLEAVHFLQTLNQAIYREFPDTVSIAEESTAWGGVSRPVQEGGLGFGMKWNMGWMHDSLAYMKESPIHRRYHHHKMTFSLVYAFNENFVLPLSHDEVVHGKGSLLGKMPGDNWQQFANLRAYYGWMWAHPGKKLLFMGCEFGQRREWTHDGQLEWWVTELPEHAGLQRFVAQLNRIYRESPALYQQDFSPAGFEWIAADDVDASVFAFLRKPRDAGSPVLVVSNMTPVPRSNYLLGVPLGGRLARAHQQRCARVRRFGLGQSWWCRRKPGANARAAFFGLPEPAAVVHPDPGACDRCLMRNQNPATGTRHRTHTPPPRPCPTMDRCAPSSTRCCRPSTADAFAVKRRGWAMPSWSRRIASPTATMCCVCMLRWRRDDDGTSRVRCR